MTASVAVGIIDSGVVAALAGRVAAACRVAPGPPAPRPAVASPDRLGHGSALARLILDAAPGVRLLVAQVFDDRPAASPAAIAAALDWLVGQGARLVNMSVGLTADRAVLRAACARAVAAGQIVVAAVPAVGPVVFPAAYPGVVGVTGDARCRG